MADVKKVLSQRGAVYGPFNGHAYIAQKLKDVMKEGTHWRDLKPYHKEALEMIQHKVARILNGDPNYDDNWVDIAGYATLAADLSKSGKDVG